MPKTVLPRLIVDRSCLVFDSPRCIALDRRLHGQGAVRRLPVVMVDPRRHLSPDRVHCVETRLVHIIPCEAAEEGLGSSIRLRTPPGRVTGDEPHGSHERSEPMRRVFRSVVAEKLDPLRVDSCLPKSPEYRFAQHLGQILGGDPRGEAPGQHHPIRTVDHDRHASLPTVPRSEARDVQGPAPVRFGHTHLPLVSPPRPDQACATGREPATPTHRFPHGLEIARQSLAREQRVDPSVAIGCSPGVGPSPLPRPAASPAIPARTTVGRQTNSVACPRPDRPRR